MIPAADIYEASRLYSIFSDVPPSKGISGLLEWHSIYFNVERATVTCVDVLLKLTGASFRCRKKRVKVGEYDWNTVETPEVLLSRVISKRRHHRGLVDEILVNLSIQ